jgi:hypothetical protein
MGGLFSKKVEGPKIDLSNATLSVGDAQKQLTEGIAAAKASAMASDWKWFATVFYWFAGLLILGGIGVGVYYLVYYNKGPTNPPALVIDSAVIKDTAGVSGGTGTVSYGTAGVDITGALRTHIRGSGINITKESGGVQKTLTPSTMNCVLQGTTTSTPCVDNMPGQISMVYHFTGDGVNTASQEANNFPSTDELIIDYPNMIAETFTNKRPPISTAKKAQPTVWGRISNMFNTTGSSPDLLPYPKDAKAEATIPSASAPQSGGQDGAYGMQFWMYIQDWNYKYGIEKHVVSRGDPSNGGIMNPSISLHPTDNSLKISISVYGDGSSSKSEPAPAGHSGATDDVYICEVPDIPLQTWLAVSVTLFSRNLDVYINGKLVKSCVLSGVPKSVGGNIDVNAGGGFSGHVCSFYHYPRMLTPDDAQAFYSQGTSCTAATDPSTSTKVTGYGFKFGVYDAAGKQVSQYVL